MIRFLQINLNRNLAANQLVFQTAEEIEADVLLISEPAIRHGPEDKWCFSTDRMAAVAITQRSPLVRHRQGAGVGFSWMSFGDLAVFSCYLRPGTTLQEYALFLGHVEDAIRQLGDVKLILAGDFNAWHTEWGSVVVNPRGSLLSDLAISLGLSLANTGSAPTFERGSASSIIDVTFVRGIVVAEWHVLEAESLSDHNYVSYAIAADNHGPPRPVPAAARGWSVGKTDIVALARYLQTRHPVTDVGQTGANRALTSSEALDVFLTGACEASMPRRRTGPPGRQPAYWWTDDICVLRGQCLALRRAYQRRLRRAGQPEVQTARSEYSAAKKRLRAAILESKKRCWSDLCAEVDNDPWGKPYKIVMGKLGSRNRGADSKGREAEIADFLFPAAPVTNWSEAPSPAVHNIFEAFDPDLNTLDFTMVIPRFTADELTRAVRRLSPRKSPGPNGLPNEVLKMFAVSRPQTALKIYNDCLTALTFPPRWKRARLVLIRKGPDKPPDQPSSYRPICMLDSSGKLLERLLLQRLESHLDAHGGRRRAANQYGFRKGVSTVSAVEKVLSVAADAASRPGTKDLCVLVTLDVKNAFNSLRWPVIDEALRRKNTPEYLVEMFRSWLSDRQLLTGEELSPRPVTCGVPQGSVLGPALWNVAYDSLLQMNVPHGVHLVGFADDLAVIGVAKTSQLLEDAVNTVLRSIGDWMSSKGLELAHHKSEAVMLTRRWAFTPPRLVVGGHVIELQNHLRYLGVILDRRLTFAAHINTVSTKASRSAAALARIMPNVNGPSQSKRRLLASVVESQLLYAAPVWCDTVAVSARTRGVLVRPQRAAALRVTRAYRTVSDEAALVLAEMPPADLLSLERKRILSRVAAPPIPGTTPPSRSSIKRQERNETIAQWQARWLSTSKAAWTRLLLPDIGRWLGRTVPKKPLSFHMTQALTGHGCFQQYLHKFGRANSPRCTLCHDESDTADHTLFFCPFFDGMRDEFRSRLGRTPRKEDIPAVLCGPVFESLPADTAEKNILLSNAEEDFRLFYRMVEAIMTRKEEEENRRQAFGRR